jgi:hypothetical protein
MKKTKMDFRGESISGGANGLQAQIDVINAEIVTINSHLTTIDTSITSLNSTTTTQGNEIRLLNQGASGNFAPFGFSGVGPTPANLSTSMTFQPPNVAGLFIPLADLVDGATFRVKLYTIIQNNYTGGTPNQLTLYLSQESKGNFYYTSATPETLPIIASPTAYVYEFNITIRTVVGHICFVSSYYPGTGTTLFTDGTLLNPFSTYGGLTILFLAFWTITSSTANTIAIYNATVERVVDAF